MQEIIISLINDFGYMGIAFLIAIENIFPPIPSEVILSFGGFMTTHSKLTIVGVVISSTIGSVIGAIVLYFIGKLLNKERLKRIVSGKVGKILRLKPKDIEKADNWFDNKGNITVLFCRFIPIVRSLISIPAGMSEMPFYRFLAYTTLGTAIWNTVLVVLGSIMGKSWVKIVKIVNEYAFITLIVLIILCIIFLVWFYQKKIKKGRTNR